MKGRTTIDWSTTHEMCTYAMNEAENTTTNQLLHILACI